MFSGSITALVTPFADGKVDEDAFARFCDWQIQNGTSALVPCGTTGEAPTLKMDEHDRLIRIAVEVSAGRVPVIAGTGSNDTQHALDHTVDAKRLGADAAMIVMPYYNKPTQEGLFRHVQAIHDGSDIPLVLYNIPGRTGVDLAIPTLARLAALPRVVAIKDATADLARPLNVRDQIGPQLCQLSGEDATVVAFLAQGGHGCISVTSNVAPRLCADLHAAWAAQDMGRVAILRDRLAMLHRVLFVETNPAPVKYAASLLGHMRPDVRLPLVELTAASKALVEEAMDRLGLLTRAAA